MQPILHHLYTVDEAIAAFGRGDRPRFLCNRDFVILRKAVLCFATVGDRPTDAELPSPSCLIWKPHRLVTDGGHEYFPWLPKSVCDTWDRERARGIRTHHTFVRLRADQCFLYAGTSHLGCYGQDGRRLQDKHADFSLNTKLPREEWIRLGGYPGWLVDLNHKQYCVDLGDNVRFRAIVDRLLRQKQSHLRMTRYEEDSLTLHTNARRGWLMYLRHPADSGLYVHDATFKGDKESLEIFRCVCGIDLEFERKATVQRSVAQRVALEFFATGKRPTCVRWQSWGG